jgi:hypothetical protein
MTLALMAPTLFCNMTVSIMTFSKMTLCIVTFCKLTLIIMTLNIMTLGIDNHCKDISIMTHSIMALNVLT